MTVCENNEKFVEKGKWFSLENKNEYDSKQTLALTAQLFLFQMFTFAVIPKSVISLTSWAVFRQ
eukprot:c10293_g1_i1 orf=2-190(-)